MSRALKVRGFLSITHLSASNSRVQDLVEAVQEHAQREERQGVRTAAFAALGMVDLVVLREADDEQVLREVPDYPTARAQSTGACVVAANAPASANLVRAECLREVMGSDELRPLVALIAVRSQRFATYDHARAPSLPERLVSGIALHGARLVDGDAPPLVLAALGLDREDAWLVVRVSSVEALAHLVRALRLMRVLPSGTESSPERHRLGASLQLPAASAFIERTVTLMGLRLALDGGAPPGVEPPMVPNWPLLPRGELLIARRHSRSPSGFSDPVVAATLPWASVSIEPTFGLHDELVRVRPNAPLTWGNLHSFMQARHSFEEVLGTRTHLSIGFNLADQETPARGSDVESTLRERVKFRCDVHRAVDRQGTWLHRWAGGASRHRLPPTAAFAGQQALLATLTQIEHDPPLAADLVFVVERILRSLETREVVRAQLYDGDTGRERATGELERGLALLQQVLASRWRGEQPDGAPPLSHQGLGILGVEKFRRALAALVTVAARNEGMEPPLLSVALGTPVSVAFRHEGIPVLSVSPHFVTDPRLWGAVLHEVAHGVLQEELVATHASPATVDCDGETTWVRVYAQRRHRLWALFDADYEAPCVRPLANAMQEAHCDLGAAEFLRDEGRALPHVRELWAVLIPSLTQALNEEHWGGLRASLTIRTLVARIYFGARAVQRRLAPLVWSVDLAQVCDDLLHLTCSDAARAPDAGGLADADLLCVLARLQVETGCPVALWRFSLCALRNDLVRLHPASRPRGRGLVLRAEVDAWIVSLVAWQRKRDEVASNHSLEGRLPYLTFVRTLVSAYGSEDAGPTARMALVSAYLEVDRELRAATLAHFLESRGDEHADAPPRATGRG